MLAERILLAEVADSNATRILEVGCGTGGLTKILLEDFDASKIFALDISDGMLARAKQRCSSNSIEWICADITTFSDEVGFDCIVSSSSLHWVSDQEKVFLKLKSLLKPGGILIFSTMSAGTFSELHSSREIALPHKMPMRALSEHSVVLQQVENAGFNIVDSSEESFEEMFASVPDFIKAMRSSGLTGGDLSHHKQALTRGDLAKLIATYENTYANERGEIPVSYRVSFVSAVLSE
jgi:malonyl-CoA O-methyltransferase